MASSLVQLGITDRDVLAELRRQAVAQGGLTQAIDSIAQRAAAMLLTCERLEVYFAGGNKTAGLLASGFVALARGAGGSDQVERRVGQAAATHLFSIATGLESRLVGEPHILGQVARALPPDRARVVSPVLARLFQDAVACGRQVRVASGLQDLSVSCVDLLLERVRSERGRVAHTAVVGSGALAKEAAQHLSTWSTRLTVFARHHDRVATDLPGVQTAPLAELPEHIASIDLIVAATSATTPIITEDLLRSSSRAISVVDLGVPANVHEGVRRLPGVTLTTLDDVLTGQARPERLIAAARGMVRARAARWSDRWLKRASTGTAVIPRGRSAL